MAESPNPSPRRLKFEQLRADYELFLQTFEKPTQIYRYLRSRQALSPLYLQRSLSYMKDRRTSHADSSKERRKKFKLDDLLDKRKAQLQEIMNKTDDDEFSSNQNENFLNITFAGFFHGPEFGEEIFNTSDLSKQASLKDEFVDVNLQLMKILTRKKKGEEFPVDSLDLGRCTSKWNPSSQALSAPASSSVSIPRKAFKEEGKTVKTHILSIQVTVPVSKRGAKRSSRKKGGSEDASQSDKDAEDSSSTVSEPPTKRPKILLSDGADDVASTPECKKRIYTAELIVFDKHKNCLLTNGEYELLLHNYWMQDGDDETIQKGKTWENGFRNKLGPFEMFAFGPTIKFKLAWKDKPIAPFQTRSVSLIQKLSKQNKSKKGQETSESVSKEQQQPQQQQLSVPSQRSLSKGARIDVCINENYGYSFGGKNRVIPSGGLSGFPTRKQPVTECIVWRPHKDAEDLQEFTEPDCTDIDGVKPFFKGHDRVYYHSDGCIPMKTSEIDYNSEHDATPDWLKSQMEYMIDEFTDVNEGEKELMKMWNSHIMKGCYISDFQLPLACKSFVEEHAREIMEKKLARNLLLHLVNLCEFNMISQPTIFSTMTVFKNIVSDSGHGDNEKI
eukprot:gene9523-17265_t